MHCVVLHLHAPSSPCRRIEPTGLPCPDMRRSIAEDGYGPSLANCLSGKSVNPVQPRFEKFFRSRLTQIKSISFVVSPPEGRLAIVTDAGRDAVAAAASARNRGRR